MKITQLQFKSTTLNVGDTLEFTAVITNDGKLGANSSQPFGPHQYRQNEQYIESFSFGLGTWLFFLHAFPYPYPFQWRWGWKGTLAPGHSITLTGKILMMIAGEMVMDAGLIAKDLPGASDTLGFQPTIIKVLDKPTA